MKMPAKLVRRLIHACERGYNWTDLCAAGEQDHAARRDKATIERTLKAVRAAIAKVQP